MGDWTIVFGVLLLGFMVLGLLFGPWFLIGVLGSAALAIGWIYRRPVG